LKTPAIAGVRIGGNGYFIPILAHEGDLYVTGDPLVGRRETAVSQLGKSYAFTGFFMEIGKGDRVPVP
jgi:hypothetical protein